VRAETIVKPHVASAHSVLTFRAFTIENSINKNFTIRIFLNSLPVGAVVDSVKGFSVVAAVTVVVASAVVDTIVPLVPVVGASVVIVIGVVGVTAVVEIVVVVVGFVVVTVVVAVVVSSPPGLH
jgi:hypothetical protein